MLKIGAVDAMGRSCNEAWLTIVLRELSTMFDQLGYKPSRTFERLIEATGA